MTPVVDAHQHYWEVARFDYRWPEQGIPNLDRDFLPEDLEPELVEVGVDGTILVQVLHTVDETTWMLELADLHPSIAGAVGWVDLTRAPDLVARDLEAVRGHPRLVGIRHLVHEEPDDDWLVRPDVLRGLSVLEAAGVPYDLLLRPQHLRHVPHVSEAAPDLPMVIDHIAKPFIRRGVVEPWGSEVRTAAQNPNVWCKLSGMITEADHAAWVAADLAPYVEIALDAFGTDRLMFGSDWPVCTLAGSYGAVVAALREVLGGIDPRVEETLFGRNAAAFYRLDLSSCLPTS